MTVTEGDPSYVGPLAGTALKLPVYHITEPEVKAAIPEAVYADQIALAEMVIDAADIANAVSEVRKGISTA